MHARDRLPRCRNRYADGKRFALCGLRCAACVVRLALCGLRCAACVVRLALCGLRCAACVVRLALCGLRCAACVVQLAWNGFVERHRGTPCVKKLALKSLASKALRQKPCVKRITHNALCGMEYAERLACNAFRKTPCASSCAYCVQCAALRHPRSLWLSTYSFHKKRKSTGPSRMVKTTGLH